MDPAAAAPGVALPAGPWLVTGAAGFLGAHTCRRLLAEGCEVVGVDALSTYSDPRLKEGRLALLRGMPGFSFHELDCADEEAVHLLVSQRRPPVVVHLAAQAGVRYSVRNPRAYVHSNLVAFGVVLEACRQHDVAHLVYASSSSVYGATAAAGHGDRSADRPVSLYAATKRADELMAHAYSHQFGLPVTGLRLFTAYGPWGRPDMAYYAFTAALLAGRPLRVFGDGTARRDFTYVDDVVDALLAVARRPPAGRPAEGVPPARLLDVGHGGQASVLDLIRLLERLTGRRARIERQPAAPGDVASTRADTGSLTALVGRAPTTGLEVGMARFVDWYRHEVQGRGSGTVPPGRLLSPGATSSPAGRTDPPTPRTSR